MAEELSGVLDHIEKIGELGDLDDVPPTSHVVDGRERAARRRAAALAAARGRRSPRAPDPSHDGFRVPSPGAAPEHERAARADRRPGRRGRAHRHASTPASCGAPTASARWPTSSTRSRWVSGEVTPPEVDRNAPLGGVPLAVKDLFCTEGIPSQAGSKILEGYRPPYTATAVERLVERGRAAAGQDEPGRVRDGLLDRELRLRPGAQPVGPLARARRLLRRLRRRGRGRRGAVGDRHRHRRLDPPARRAVRDRRAQADLRRGQPLRDDRLRLLARPGRARSRATSPTPRCCSPRWSGEDPCDSTSLAFPEPIGLPTRHRPARPPPRRARGALRRGHRAGRAAALPTRRSRSRKRPRRRDRRHHAPARAARARRLLPDRPRRGVGQPRPLRRRPLRPARARRRPAGDVRRARAPRASAPRSSAASCSAPTRSPPATTTPTTARPRRCARRSPRTSTPPGASATSWSRRPAPAPPSSSAPRPTTRGRCTSTTTARCRSRSPGCPPSRSPTGSPTGCRPASRSPARRSARTASSTPPTRSSRRSASTARRRAA